MVRWLKPKIDGHDFLYLSFLAIAGSGLVTLVLFCLYSWYDTGRIPVLDGIPAIGGADGVRFWIGSIFVPVLLAFSGIAIAHRLLGRPRGPRLSPSMGDDLLRQKTTESDSGAMEYILDVLSGPDATNTAFWEACKAEPAPAGWGADRQTQQPHQPAGHYDRSFTHAVDKGPVSWPLLKHRMASEAPARDEVDVIQPEPAGSVPQERVVAMQSQQLYDDSGRASVQASDQDRAARSIPRSRPVRAEATPADKKEPAQKMDFIEQLKDPAIREKLAALLADVEV